MNRQEYLFTCLGEECNEVGQRVAKALRFGLHEVQAGQPLDNESRIREELIDLMAVAQILHNEGALSIRWPTGAEIDAKLAKIEKFMAISREQGVLS